MKIDNTTSNSFKGLYLVKGNGRQITDVSKKIYQKCSSPQAKNIIKLSETIFEKEATATESLKDFKNCFCEMLTGLYGDRQPLVQMLVATNEDTKFTDTYYNNLFAMNGIEDVENVDDVHLQIFKNRVDKFFKKNANNFIEYNQAQKKFLENGNVAPLTSFILKQAVAAKNKLNEILIPFNKKETDIPVLQANDVIKAIDNDSFDYINGSLIK